MFDWILNAIDRATWSAFMAIGNWFAGHSR